jgi:hypothetical protein
MEVDELAKLAETACLETLRLIDGMQVRESTDIEDSGLRQIVKDLAIDGVAYDTKTEVAEEPTRKPMRIPPSIALQVTIASDSVVRAKKQQELVDRPFIRLPEMRLKDVAIPRALVVLDADSMKQYAADRDIVHHPDIRRKVLKNLEVNMDYMLTRTLDTKEQEHLRHLRSRFKDAREGIAA